MGLRCAQEIIGLRRSRGLWQTFAHHSPPVSLL